MFKFSTFSKCVIIRCLKFNFYNKNGGLIQLNVNVKKIIDRRIRGEQEDYIFSKCILISKNIFVGLYLNLKIEKNKIYLIKIVFYGFKKEHIFF